VASKESVGHTIKVALLLCIVCSVVVSAAAVWLRPAQQENKALDRKSNILAAAGLLKPGLGIDEQFASITSRAVNLDTGKFTDDINPEEYDQRKASKNPALSEALSRQADTAKISRRVKYSVVYLVENEQGIDKVILPIKGYALWSTLYGFLALESDLNTVAGIGFYEHAETPGLGGEIDNPLWKSKWIGKKIYDTEARVALRVLKGQVDTGGYSDDDTRIDGSSGSTSSGKDGRQFQIDGLSGATLTSRGVHNLIQFWLGSSGYAPFLANLKKGDA
jgi:Na+-transporting NADH:ubiquinone oxidoreductase subunit C